MALSSQEQKRIRYWSIDTPKHPVESQRMIKFDSFPDAMAHWTKLTGSERAYLARRDKNDPSYCITLDCRGRL